MLPFKSAYRKVLQKCPFMFNEIKSEKSEGCDLSEWDGRNLCKNEQSKLHSSINSHNPEISTTDHDVPDSYGWFCFLISRMLISSDFYQSMHQIVFIVSNNNGWVGPRSISCVGTLHSSMLYFHHRCHRGLGGTSCIPMRRCMQSGACAYLCLCLHKLFSITHILYVLFKHDKLTYEVVNKRTWEHACGRSFLVCTVLVAFIAMPRLQ